MANRQRWEPAVIDLASAHTRLEYDGAFGREEAIEVVSETDAQAAQLRVVRGRVASRGGRWTPRVPRAPRGARAACPQGGTSWALTRRTTRGRSGCASAADFAAPWASRRTRL